MVGYKYPIAFMMIYSFYSYSTSVCMSMRKDKAYIAKSTQIHYSPRGYNQKLYVDTLHKTSNKLLLVTGPAGTGKTMFACLKAVELLKMGEINKVVVTRPIVTADEEFGFLPGNIAKKMDPWTRPLFDLFLEHYTKSELENLINTNVIEISPLAFMRGRTFKHSFIIADEMQNSSPNQMKMLTTRIGIHSRLVITGDLDQSDRTTDNGLKDIMTKIKNYKNDHHDNMIQIIAMNDSDIERSEIVRKIINIYKGDQGKPSWASMSPYDTSSNNKFDFDAMYRRNKP
jgi:phosphate starvation-inducible PhoH-like protein